MSTATITEIEQEILKDLDFDHTYPCEYPRHRGELSGAVWYVVQKPVKPCGCPGIVWGFCQACLDRVLACSSFYCRDCGAVRQGSPSAVIARIEPVKP